MQSRLAISFVVLLAACSSRTQLVVVVDSDLAIPAQLDRVVVQAQGNGGPMEASADLASIADLPQTLGLSPAGEGGAITITAIGYASGAEVVRQEVRTSFVSGSSRVVRLSLARLCIGLPCDGGMSCVAGACRDASVDGDLLPEWDGNEPQRFLMGTDSSVPPLDAGPDAGDAGTPDEDSGMPPDDPFRGVAAGGSHSCGLTSMGAVYCWGANGRGQLGDGTTGERRSPVAVVGLGGPATAVAAGLEHTCAIVGGNVYCWGANSDGQLGNRATAMREPMPVQVVDTDRVPLSGATAVAAGHDHTCAIAGGGAVHCWGANASGQLGDTTTAPKPFAVEVGFLTGADDIGVGNAFTCVRVDTGALCWGSNTRGQLGDGSMSNRSAPLPVGGAGGATNLGVGDAHACTSTGTEVLCWGANERGQLGDGTTMDQPTATAASLSPAADLSLGAAHSCARDGSTVRCWGAGTAGQLGNGMADSPAPLDVGGLTGPTGIAAGGTHTCASTSGGAVFCWGANPDGRLGDGSTRTTSTPVEAARP